MSKQEECDNLPSREVHDKIDRVESICIVDYKLTHKVVDFIETAYRRIISLLLLFRHNIGSYILSICFYVMVSIGINRHQSW